MAMNNAARQVQREYEYEREYEYQRRPERQSVPPRRAITLGAALRIILTLCLVCSVAIGLVYVKARITYTQREINTLQRDIAAAERARSDRQELLDEARSMRRIMERAQELGMGYPQADQVSTLRVPASPAAPADTSLERPAE